MLLNTELLSMCPVMAGVTSVEMLVGCDVYIAAGVTGNRACQYSVISDD